MMGDSFFGRYARETDGKLSSGRLYLGIHASNYGSSQTTQVRAFASALFRPYSFATDRRDPWWTLLAFYNSIRELGGAKTLFDSDIRSRLKFMFNREDFGHDKRRNLRIVEELTSRLSQAEIVAMMDRLSAAYDPAGDSEGTLGGLVRLGRADRLGPVMRRALGSASWCSADPVCSEHLGGQGSKLANLAAFRSWQSGVCFLR
jgi:hypothetical protein